MRSNKFKVLLIILFLTEIVSLFLTYKSFSNKELVEIKETHDVNKKTFSMFIENEEGNYEEFLESNTFPEDYKINIEKSKCVDTKGNKIENILSSINNNITVTSNKTAYCYLYFDGVKTIGDYLLKNPSLGLNLTLEGDLYRFQGSSDNVNNYICFGTSDKSECIENKNYFLYRIIGINENKNLKLIMNEIFEKKYYWTNLSGTITWLNSQMYSNLNGADFLNNTMYISTDWQNKIETTNWKYGNVDYSLNGANQTAINLYNVENSWTNTIDAKIGLMYLHDFYLSNNSSVNCYSDFNSCSNSWLQIMDNEFEWTMSHLGYNAGLYSGWVISSSAVTYSYDGSENLVRPVFYLKASVKYYDGEGTIDNPYIIS